jgi:hypothetical protein
VSKRLLLLVGCLVALVVAAVLSGAAQAAWTKLTSASHTVASATLGAPSGLNATPSGHGVALTWSAGTNGTGYSLLGVANGSSSNCSSATFVALTTIAGLATASYSDASRFTPQGTWYCYQLKTTAGTNWTSTTGNPTDAAQLGFVASTVSVTNGGTSGRLDTGDVLTFTFNQAVATATGPSGTNSVCAVSGGNTIVVGSTTTSGGCAAGETTNLGVLSGGSANTSTRYAATYAWSNSNQTLTVTVGSRTSGVSAPTISGSWTFDPTSSSTKLQSSTGAFHICDTNTGGGACNPTLSGSF